jgi:hypothetical protein
LTAAGVHNNQAGSKVLGLPPSDGGLHSDDFLNNNIIVGPKAGRKVTSNHTSNGGTKNGTNIT